MLMVMCIQTLLIGQAYRVSSFTNISCDLKVMLIWLRDYHQNTFKRFVLWFSLSAHYLYKEQPDCVRITFLRHICIFLSSRNYTKLVTVGILIIFLTINVDSYMHKLLLSDICYFPLWISSMTIWHNALTICFYAELFISSALGRGLHFLPR